MRRIVLGCSLLLLAVSVRSQPSQLEIPAGAAYEIQPAQAVLQLDRLVIGNGARIRFAPGVDRWTLVAGRSVIGNGVVIEARGWPGVPGEDGPFAGPPAKACEDGAAGGAGTAGGRAGDGVILNLSLGFLELGDLLIVSDGGNGGVGGRGGAGQDGGPIQRCRAGDGGDGGAGGAGGSGGNGGDVKVTYRAPAGAAALLRQRIRVSSLGGTGGGGGLGAQGGGAEDGQYLRGSGGGPGGKKWLAGGKRGSRGADGAPGKPGANGDIQLAAVQAVSPATTPGAGLPATGPALEQLHRRLEQLEERVRQLEAGD